MSGLMAKAKRIAKAAVCLAIPALLSAALFAVGQYALIPAVEYLRRHAGGEASALFAVLAYVFVYLEAREEEKRGHNYKAFIYGSTAVAMALAAVLL